MNEIDKITTFFSREQLFQAYLDVEVALAKAQAKQKIIPEKAAQKIAEMARDKRIEGISHVQDESDRSGVRVVIELKRDATAEVVLTQFFKFFIIKQVALP